MAITEKQLFEALGVGAQAQEPADPATPQQPTVDNDPPAGNEPTQEGAQVQDPADPAVVTDPETDPPEDTGTEPTAGSADDDKADSGTDGDKQLLTPQQRRENAARRRQQEQQEAINSAVQAALQQERDRTDAALEGFFKRANIKNTVTGEPITNVEQFLAWEAKLREERLNAGLKSGKMTAELLDEAISQHPVVQKAQALINKSASDAQTAQQQAMAAKVQAEMEEIRKLDPSIKSVADLKNMPTFQQFYELVGKNYSFLDAFRLANFERLQTSAAETGRQQAALNARGKDHLQATGNSRGSGAASVPKEEMDMFRLLNPNATEAQIQAYYNKHKK